MDNLNSSAVGAKSGLEALLADLEGTSTVETSATSLSELENQLALVETENVTHFEETDALDAGLTKIFDHKAVKAAEAVAQKAADKVAKEAAAAQRKIDRETAAAAKKLEREMAAAQKVADRETKKVADAADKEAAAVLKAAEPTPEPEKPAEPKIYWGKNKLGRLEHRLGENVDNVMLFDINDGDLDEADRAALIAGNKTYFKTLPVKVQDQSTSILEFVGGRSYRMNPSVDITVRLLGKAKVLTAGDKGNLYLRLRDLYSIGSARSMGGATILALKALEIVKMTGVGTFTPNPNSALLALLSAKLLLPFIDQDAALQHLEDKETAKVAARIAPVVPPVATAPVVVPVVAAPSDDSIMADLLTGLKGIVQEPVPAFEDALF